MNDLYRTVNLPPLNNLPQNQGEILDGDESHNKETVHPHFDYMWSDSLHDR